MWLVSGRACGRVGDGGRRAPNLTHEPIRSARAASVTLAGTVDEKSSVRLSPSTLGDWNAASADLYEPLHREARR